MAADDEVAVVVAEVERSDQHRAAHVAVLRAFLASERRAEAVARIAAQADAQAPHRAVVDAECAGQCGAGFRESGRMRAAGNPAAAAETVGVEAREQHRLVLPGARTPLHGDARFVPRGGQQGVLALGAVDGEEVGRRVVFVRGAHGHDELSDAQGARRAEAFADPQLFEHQCAVALFSAVAPFSAVDEDRLGAERPAAAEVAAERERSMGYVEPVAAAGAVCGVVRRRGEAEFVREGRFACAPDREAQGAFCGRGLPGGRVCVVRRRAGCRVLCRCGVLRCGA